MEQFTLSMSFWIAMNYGTAPMMVPHGVMAEITDLTSRVQHLETQVEHAG